jgi:hypothetical protein
MNPGALLLVIVFLAVGCMLGWHAQRARSAHGDVRTTKNRLPGFRKTRMRSGLYVLGLLVAALIVMSALVHH